MKHFEIPVQLTVTALAETREEAISMANQIVNAGTEAVEQGQECQQLLNTRVVIDHPNIKEKDNPYV